MDLLIYFTGCPVFKSLNYCRCLCFAHLGEHVASGPHPISFDLEDNRTPDDILATMNGVRIGRHVAYELPADSSAKENALLKATV